VDQSRQNGRENAGAASDQINTEDFAW